MAKDQTFYVFSSSRYPSPIQIVIKSDPESNRNLKLSQAQSEDSSIGDPVTALTHCSALIGPLMKNIIIEPSERHVTLKTFDQSDALAQQKDRSFRKYP